ncbi:MAG: hypothetical protein LBT01_00145 [Spirochaetaceae bacterium]|nr:hypothetical protein [Spirochaetaceae bacterium]
MKIEMPSMFAVMIMTAEPLPTPPSVSIRPYHTKGKAENAPSATEIAAFPCAD